MTLSEQVDAFFARAEAADLKLTYDDVRLHTDHSDVLPSEADLRTRFTRNITLNIPFISSPMDTVTESDMAIALAVAGGIGIIHRGLSPEAQAEEVSRVKLHLNGLIENPLCAQEGDSVASVLAMREAQGRLFHRFPVVNKKGKLLGIVTKDDFDLCEDYALPVEAIMTPVGKLTTAPAGTSQEKAYELMRRTKRKSLPLVDKSGKLLALYVYSDLRRIRSGSSTHNLDAKGHLRVGAAVGAGKDFKKRAELLAKRGCDVFQVDTAHADSLNVMNAVKFLKKEYPKIDVVAGNISNGEAAKRLVAAGADGILVGQGPGSICTTRIIAGIGVPQVSAIHDCAKAIRGSGVPIVADGGITNSGDVVIALAVGAEAVMVGRALAGTDESPGDMRIVEGVKMKAYRGMGSLGAMRDNASSRERYGQVATTGGKFVPEGVEGIVPYQGSAADVLRQYTGGVRQGLGYIGAKDIPTLGKRARIFRITNSGIKESRPHDVRMTELPPNYRG